MAQIAPESPVTDADADALAFLRALIAAQPQGEGAVQALVRARLESGGCTVEARPYDPAAVPLVGEFAEDAARTPGQRVNVIARLPGDPARRSLLMFAHPDSEPVPGDAGWTVDPFSGVQRDGRLHGWGVADDLAGIASGVLAIERAAQAGVPLGEVVLVSAPSKRHARGVAAALHDDVGADAALYLHPAESGAGWKHMDQL